MPNREIFKIRLLPPETSAAFEPKKNVIHKRKSPPFKAKIPSLLRGLEEVRTYFMKNVNVFPILLFLEGIPGEAEDPYINPSDERDITYIPVDGDWGGSVVNY